jgi:shikimate kinase/dTDP-4-dehydrorhamnose reductase
VQALARSIAEPIDTIVHCASTSRGGTEVYRSVYQQGMANLAAAFPTARLAFTSSSSVYPQVDGSEVTETSLAAPSSEAGNILRATEELVLARGGLIARLAGIYGPWRSFLLKTLLEGNASIEGNEGQGRYLNQIHREDAASALAHLIQANASGIYNIADSTPQTQREAYDSLCLMFGLNLPPAVPPREDRKRGWTHKRVSNAKLRATGWAPRYPSYQSAIETDTYLVPSILDLVSSETGRIPRSPNIVLVGLMGSGKSTIGRIVAQKIGFQFIDTDQLIIESAGCPIAQIFEREGEDGFRSRESAALRSLLGRRGHIIATGGGIVTQPHNLQLLKHLGYIIWLDANTTTLHRRTANNFDRPLLNADDPKAKLDQLMAARADLYKGLADIRIKTDNLSLQETSYGVAESARIYFAGFSR